MTGSHRGCGVGLWKLTGKSRRLITWLKLNKKNALDYLSYLVFGTQNL